MSSLFGALYDVQDATPTRAPAGDGALPPAPEAAGESRNDDLPATGSAEAAPSPMSTTEPPRGEDFLPHELPRRTAQVRPLTVVVLALLAAVAAFLVLGPVFGRDGDRDGEPARSESRSEEPGLLGQAQDALV